MAGGPRPGAGRPKGSPNKATAAKEAAIAASGLTPLDYMLKLLRDETLPTETRFDAAKAAAPYVHPKLANIEHTGKDGGPMEIANLSPLDRAKALAALLAKVPK